MNFRLRIVSPMLLALASLGVGAGPFPMHDVHAAPSSAVPATMTQITVTGTDFSRVPARLSAGLIRLNLNTPQPNGSTQITIGRLQNPGARSKVAAGMRKGINAVFPFLTLNGGVGGVPHSTQTAIFNLTPGMYVIFDLDGLTANKNPHSPYHFVTVTGQASTVTPMTTATVRAVDFRFRTSGQISSGFDTLKFVNSGHEPHEMDLMKLAPGKTKNDVMMALKMQSEPKWAQPVGGWGVLSPGHSQWLRIHLTPGNYVLLCFVPDTFSYPGHKATNQPHAMLGMVKVIHVN